MGESITFAAACAFRSGTARDTSALYFPAREAKYNFFGVGAFIDKFIFTDRTVVLNSFHDVAAAIYDGTAENLPVKTFAAFFVTELNGAGIACDE